MNCTDCLERLDAYVDGELSADEARDLAQHLAVCPECARARAGASSHSAVRSRRDSCVIAHPTFSRHEFEAPSLAEPPPAFRPPASAMSWIRIAAASVLVAALEQRRHARGDARRGTRASSVESEVVASHIRSLMPGHLTDVVSTNQHNVKPWFNGRVDFSPAVPSLDSAGFPLVGGRVDYVGGRVVPVTVYSRRQHMINVYAWPAEGGEGRSIKAEHFTERGYNVVRWTSGGIELWAVSDLNAPELDQFVERFNASR